MKRSWIYRHTECLRHDHRFASKPGGFAVIVQQPVSVRLSEEGEPMSLAAGRTLFSRHEANLGAAVQNHLFGTVYGSDLRLGVALLMRFAGPDIGGVWSEEERERRVDAWLDDNTAIALGQLPKPMMDVDIDAPLNRIWQRVASFSSCNPK